MPILVAENLFKSYGKVAAVRDLCLQVDEGAVVGLIGPNGAGKTTTIKMILGLMKPDKGHVEVFGQNPWDNSSVHSQIGVVYEKPFFPPSERVQAYLERVCRILGVHESRAMEVLELVDLEEARDRAIRGLSAGMLQNFAIAHALIHEPRFVVADEMTSNLDPEARISLLDLVLQLNKNKKVTFLLSSHILPELSRVCDSAVIINKGMVYASGSLKELYEKFTARTVRISTDKPEELVKEMKRLPYVEEADFDTHGISVKVAEEGSDSVYEDIPRLAKAVKAKILGIETANASLEELYTTVVGSEEER